MADLQNGLLIEIKNHDDWTCEEEINWKQESQPASQGIHMLQAVKFHHDTFWPFELLEKCTEPATLH